MDYFTTIQRKHKRVSPVVLKGLVKGVTEAKHAPLPPAGSWSWKPIGDPMKGMSGYEATGKMAGRAKIEKRKVGQAQRWFLVFDGKDYELPKRRVSFDHAEGLMLKLTGAEMESINVEELINEVVSGKTPDEAIDEAFERLKKFGAAVKRGVSAVRRGAGAVRRGVQKARRTYHKARRRVKRARLRRAIKQGQRVKARKAKFMAKAAAKMKRQQQRAKFKSTLSRLSRGEAKELDTYGLIECVRDGIDPGQLLAEKVSYSYDPRLDQNIATCPVAKDERGKFAVRRAYNAVTGEEGHSEPAQPKE